MPPDLIITDLIMPNMDGYDFLEYLKQQEHLAQIPVVVASAYGNHEEKEKSLSIGASAFVSNPINRDELLTVMGELLELEWRTEELPSEGAMRMDGKMTLVNNFSYPPEDKLEFLLHLAECGLLSRLQKEIKQLKVEDESWHPFLDKLLEYAINYDAENLETMLQKALPAIAS